MAGRPPATQPAHRRNRQYASRRILHRQAVFARQLQRPLRFVRNARVRNAAARAYEPDAATALALAHREVLEQAVPAREADALGHRAARSFHAAVLHRAGPARRANRADRRRLSTAAGVVRSAPGVSFSKYGDFATRGV